ncbi:MAG: formyltetrahydrofolate deformylase [Acidobacteriaceae bacterium]
MTDRRFVLKLCCADVPGLVAEVSSYLFQAGCNILEAQQFNDVDTSRFFMRIRFEVIAGRDGVRGDTLRENFKPIAARRGMEWTLESCDTHKRVMILVSRQDHCLTDLLYRQRLGELKMEVTAVVSNHPQEAFPRLDLEGIPFHYLPVTSDTKAEQEDSLWNLIESTRSELIVLARYMQVLSNHLAARLEGRCINIHHSFLPGFKGARPYHQAHQRGVKLIGATSHFVTASLDEGPIIEQDVERISHSDTVEDLIQKGRDIERRVLAKAVKAYLENRIMLNGSKTVVFEP